jgi:hypothetical protein
VSSPRHRIFNPVIFRLSDTNVHTTVILNTYSAAFQTRIQLRKIPSSVDIALTNSTKQSPFCEANRSSSSQQISRILRKLEIRSRIHQSLPRVRSTQSMSLHPTCCFKIQFNIVLSPTPRSSIWFRSLRYPKQNPV